MNLKKKVCFPGSKQLISQCPGCPEGPVPPSARLPLLRPGCSPCMQSWVCDLWCCANIAAGLPICQEEALHSVVGQDCCPSRAHCGVSAGPASGMLPAAPVPGSPPELAGARCPSFALRAQPAGGELPKPAAFHGCSPALPASHPAGRECAFPSLPGMFVCKQAKWPCLSGKWQPFIGE